MRKLLNRFFKLEEINGGHVCPTYLYRWTLFRCKWFAIYLHNFVGDDWSTDMHDHPKRFVSIGLWGHYIEETPSNPTGRKFTAPWCRSFPAEHVHRLRLIDGKPCWTLVTVFSASRPWGFWNAGKWIHWRTYVGSADAQAAKSCPD